MAITNSEHPKFKAYAGHVFYNEGPMGDDPNDHAASCVANLTGANVAKRGKAGRPIHTVKGITYCTFKSDAARLGITPVNHARFVSMTTDDATKFLFDIFKNKPWANTKDSVGLALAETAWGSGDGRVWPTIIDTLNVLQIPTIAKKAKLTQYTAADKKKLIDQVNKVPEKIFFEAYWQVRYNWLDALGRTPYGSRYRNGWLRRQREFKDLAAKFFFKYSGLSLFFLVTVASLIIFRKKIFGRNK